MQKRKVKKRYELPNITCFEMEIMRLKASEMKSRAMLYRTACMK